MQYNELKRKVQKKFSRCIVEHWRPSLAVEPLNASTGDVPSSIGPFETPLITKYKIAIIQKLGN